MPSALYISFRPVKTDEVSRVTNPAFGIVVPGEDVDIARLGTFECSVG